MIIIKIYNNRGMLICFFYSILFFFIIEITKYNEFTKSDCIKPKYTLYKYLFFLF